MGIAIDHDVCDGNGACADACPTSVIEVKDGKCTVVNNDDCIDCELCVSVCPTSAISMLES